MIITSFNTNILYVGYYIQIPYFVCQDLIFLFLFYISVNVGKCYVNMLCTYNTYEMMSKNFYLIRDKMQFFSFTIYIINIGFNVLIWLSYIYDPLIFVSDLAILLLCTVGHHNMNIDILILVLNSRVSPYQYLRCSDSSFFI